MASGDAALLDELLRRQARAHGLATWRDTAPTDQADASTREELAEESARLSTFAGMRSAAAAAPALDAAGGALEGGAADSDGDGDGELRPLSPLAEAAADAEALQAHGLETLKAELQRLGMKCGGTLQERAARLFAVRGRTRLHAEDAALLAKTLAAVPPPARGAKRVPRQGPLLPGQQRTKLLKPADQ